MLSEEERRSIEAEERATAHARQADADAARQRLAALAYRREVRAALSPRPWWWPLRWALPFLPVVVLVAWLALRPAPVPTLPDDALGGITSAQLVTRCRTSVSEALHVPAGDLQFPPVQDATTGISASVDGRRWDGQVTRPDGRLLDFTCTYSPADDRTSVDLLEAP